MINKNDLYIYDIPEFTQDLFRMGNSTWPAFTEERAHSDVIIVNMEGIDMVIANGNGFSAFNYITPIMKRPNKKIWKIKKGGIIPPGLRLAEDMRAGHEGHFMIVPEQDMPLKKYLGLLEELGMDRTSVELLRQSEIEHA